MTIKDIAKECGCGLGTVSRALNNKPGVKAETKKKILAVVEKYGFVSNSYAKQLKSQDSHMIAIIIKGATSVMLTTMLSIIQKKLETLPFIANVFVLDEEENEAKFANKLYYEKRPVGIIFLGGNPDNYKEDFDKLKIPCVLISTEADNIENEKLSSVSIDNEAAAEASADYLISLGHRKIGVIGGYLQHFGVTTKRLKGFLKSMEKSGIKFDVDKYYVPCKYSFSEGEVAVKTLMGRCADVTAVFTMADSMAIGAIRGLKDLGYSVPEDISVMGIDGLPICTHFIPRVSTIKQDMEALAEKGLELLIKEIKNNADAKAEHIIIPFELIEGESVKSIK